MSRTLQPGTVVRYPFLWSREDAAGETEGRKDRPSCLLISVKVNEKTHLLLAPITSKQPHTGVNAIKVPELEKQRAGLTSFPDAWIICEELNADILELSAYYNPSKKPFGMFSTRFTAEVVRQVHVAIRAGTRTVKRFD